MNYLEEYKKWCESPEFDEQTKKERLKILNDKNKEAVINSNKKCVGKTLNVLYVSGEESKRQLKLRAERLQV